MRKPKPLYIYLHLPKCAGTTFREHVEQQLPPEARLAFYNRQDSKLSRSNVFEMVEALPDERKAHLKLIYGHEVYYGLHRYFDRPTRYIVFVRDAFSHSLSFFNYRIQKDQQKKPNNINQSIDFSTWFEANDWMHDEMIGYLSDYGYLDSNDQPLGERVSLALDKFWYIGLTETANDEFLYFYRLLNINRFLRNQNRSDRFLKYLSESDKKLIAKRSPGDLLLYTQSVERNKKFHDQNPSFRRLLPLLKARRATYRFLSRLR